ncbi:MAG TPA: Ig-like domain-containing protein [Gemmatimonadaceae bacterium]|nr:Ig-like domain-containing protein [Gemmatimonadaceae bacterium]
MALVFACAHHAAPAEPVIDSGTICAVPGFAGVEVDIRRPDGRPIAPGAKLVVTDGAYRDSVVEVTSPLSIGAAENRAGTYTVEVTKPFYQPVTITNVNVPGGPCGAFATVKVPITLQPVADAPAIRSVSVSEPGVGLGIGYTMQYETYVDAVPGTDTSVTWSVSDPRAASIDSTGFVRALCGTKDDIHVIATSRRDPSKFGTGRLGVFGPLCP